MTLLLSLTYFMASGQSIPLFFIKQAIIKLALLDTPAAQWTRTLRPQASRASSQSQFQSKRWMIFQSQWSAIPCFLQLMLSNFPYNFLSSNGVIKQLPQTQIAVILYCLMVYSSMAASSLPKYKPYSICWISGQSLGLFSLNFSIISADLVRHSSQIYQPGPKGLLTRLSGVSVALHCMQNFGYPSS